MSTPGSEPPAQPMNDEKKSATEAISGETELTKWFCAASIGLGTAYALRYKKGVMPMIAAGAVGTSVDMVYGYLVECAQFREPTFWEENSIESDSNTK